MNEKISENIYAHDIDDVMSKVRELLKLNPNHEVCIGFDSNDSSYYIYTRHDE